ncbi:MAG: membrane protein insertase YidC, partial [Pseudomonadota bacterium]
MDDQNKNLIMAMVLSTLVLVIWMVLFAPPPPTETANIPDAEASEIANVPAAPSATETGNPEETVTATPEAPRVSIETPSLRGSVSLAGGRIDQLSLVNYDVSLEPEADQVTLLSPVGSERPYYAVFGWVPGGDLAEDEVPGTETVWLVERGDTLTPETPVVLRWDSPSGLIFRRTISVDDRFLFSVSQAVENTSDTPKRLAPYGLVARHGEPQDLSGFFIIHEGAIRRTDGQLEEIDYSDMPGLANDDRWGANASVQQAQESGWIGFTDHYWMTALIPEQGAPFTSVVQYLAREEVYRTAARLPTLEVAPGATEDVTTQVFAGAKEWETIRDYEAGRRIEGFVPSLSYFMGFGG